MKIVASPPALNLSNTANHQPTDHRRGSNVHPPSTTIVSLHLSLQTSPARASIHTPPIIQTTLATPSGLTKPALPQAQLPLSQPFAAGLPTPHRSPATPTPTTFKPRLDTPPPPTCPPSRLENRRFAPGTEPLQHRQPPANRSPPGLNVHLPSTTIASLHLSLPTSPARASIHTPHHPNHARTILKARPNQSRPLLLRPFAGEFLPPPSPSRQHPASVPSFAAISRSTLKPHKPEPIAANLPQPRAYLRKPTTNHFFNRSSQHIIGTTGSQNVRPSRPNRQDFDYARPPDSTDDAVKPGPIQALTGSNAAPPLLRPTLPPATAANLMKSIESPVQSPLPAPGQ